MSVVERDPMSEVLDRVNTWPPAQGITLARRILESLEARPISELPPPDRSKTWWDCSRPMPRLRPMRNAGTSSKRN
jgi:hypothetical protein